MRRDTGVGPAFFTVCARSGAIADRARGSNEQCRGVTGIARIAHAST
jgi:hypothetical protein